MRYRSILAAVALAAACSANAAFADDQALDGYRPVDLSGWQSRVASSALGTLEPLYRNHPEMLEGRPTMTLNLKKGDDGNLIIDLEMRGYLDDSVEGEQYRAHVTQGQNGWELLDLGVRYICARGANAGTPTTRLCP